MQIISQENLHILKKSSNFAAKICKIMNYEEIKTELRAIVETPARNLKKEQRARIEEIAKELGVESPDKKRCNSCWIDTAVMCASAIDERQAQSEEPKEDGRKYVLKKGTDVIFMRTRINELTLTDELAREIIARGFPKRFFEKCE